MIPIILIVIGFVFLCMQRIPYGRRALRGPLLNVVCALLIVPPFVFFWWGFKVGFEAGVNNDEVDMDKWRKIERQVELPTYAGVVVLSWLIVHTGATSVQKRRRRRKDDYDDYEERRGPRRRSHHEDDDDRHEDHDDNERRGRIRDDDDRGDDHEDRAPRRRDDYNDRYR